jgi:hypothetical protein
MGQGLLITAANALICIKSSYSTENFRQWAMQAGLIMPMRQKPGRSMADLAAPGRLHRRYANMTSPRT